MSPGRTGASVDGMSTNDELRERAINRLKAKQQFWGLVVVWVGVSALCTVIWALSGADNYFWPIWPMFGIAIGVVVTGWRAFAPASGGITESKIQAEMDRLDKS